LAQVTIGWAANASLLADAVVSFAKTANARPTSFRAREVALGTVGPHGTVLAGQDFANFNITT
jgi:hypothetical protein